MQLSRKRIRMRSFIGMVILSALIQAEGSMLYKRLFIDFDNAYTKDSGFANIYIFEHQLENFKLFGSISDQKVKRLHPTLRTPIETLDVQKYAFGVDYGVDNNWVVKTRYIWIDDNVAPTDEGEVYGLGVMRNVGNGYIVDGAIYRGLYDGFDCNQYEVALTKKLPLGGLKLKTGIRARYIDVDSGMYGVYALKQKHYNSLSFHVGGAYENYFFGLHATYGKRLFSVLNDGKSVEHHAMMMRDTYSLNIGKKIDRFDIILGYLYRDAKELPSNRDNVKTNAWSVALKYNY